MIQCLYKTKLYLSIQHLEFYLQKFQRRAPAYFLKELEIARPLYLFCRDPDKKRFFLVLIHFFFLVAGPVLWESLLTVIRTFLRRLMVGFKVLM